MITIINRQRKYPFDTAQLEAGIQKILDAVGYSDFDIGVLITTNKTIRWYNKAYRMKDKPTDILSFSYHKDLQPGKRIKVTTEEDKNLGDLILSPEYIAKAAKEMNTSFENRFHTLLIHGICHLLGYDHETDEEWRSMEAKEAAIAKKIAD